MLILLSDQCSFTANISYSGIEVSRRGILVACNDFLVGKFIKDRSAIEGLKFVLFDLVDKLQFRLQFLFIGTTAKIN